MSGCDSLKRTWNVVDIVGMCTGGRLGDMVYYASHSTGGGWGGRVENEITSEHTADTKPSDPKTTLHLPYTTKTG